MAATIAPSWDLPYAGKDRWLLRFFPSLTDLAFFLPLILLLCLPNGMNSLLGDADTGWHIRTGEWILQHHAVPHIDIFSWTKAGQPWFAWEWGWDVLFALIHQQAGLAGVLFVNIGVLCSAAVLLYRSVRSACGEDLLALAITGLGLFASAVHWHARPHLLAWLFFLILLRVLHAAERGRSRALLLLPLLFLVWANMHGSFVAGLLMIAVSATGAALEVLLVPEMSWAAAAAGSKQFWLALLGCSAVTLVNPYGWHEHAHIFHYLRDAELIDMIQEFESVSFHSGTGAALGYLLLVGLPALLWCLQRRRWTTALQIAFWTHAALVSARNVPLFVFVVCPPAAAMLASAGSTTASYGLTKHIAGALASLSAQLRPFERVGRYHLPVVFGLGILACCLASGQPEYAAHFTSYFPASAIPVIEKSRPERLFTSDQWGDYVLYRLYPGTRVNVDGRSDLYGQQFLKRCNHILNARWDWESNLSADSADMVLLSPTEPLATALKASPRWSLVFDDGKAVVFGRRFSPAVERALQRPLPPQQVSAVARNRGRGLEAEWLTSEKH